MLRRPRLRPRLRIERDRLGTIAVCAASAILFAVLAPLHGTVYQTAIPLTFLLGIAICVSPVLALSRPRTAIALFCPASVALSLSVSSAGGAIAPWPWSVPTLLVFVLLVGTVVLRHGARLGLYPLVIGVLGSLTAPLLRPDIDAGGAGTANLIVAAAVTGAAYLVAVLVAGRVRIGAELTREREHTALEQVRRELVEERTRIARELHDVIAHSMSVIQVQASTARYRLPALAPDAAAEFESIASTARGSLIEMRRMLGVLRTEDHTAELAPQHGIDDVDSLIDSLRRAGATVGLDITGSVTGIPLAVQIATYRIVQEGLSNAVRHSPGAPIAVRIRTDSTSVRISVTNGPGESAPSSTGSGHGLRGMRERAELLGGSLTAGPQTEGGWAVIADLPLDIEQEQA